MIKPTKRVTVSHVVPPELAEKIAKGAHKADTSKSRYVTKVLKAHFAKRDS